MTEEKKGIKIFADRKDPEYKIDTESRTIGVPIRDEGVVISPFGPCIYHGAIRTDILHEIQTRIDQVRGDQEADMGHLLAGRIMEQYNITDLVSDSVFEHIMLHVHQMLNGIEGQTGYPADSIDVQHLGVDALWVNIQKAREYNPPHMHDGMWSFVLYTQNDLSYEDAVNNHYDQQKGQQLAGSLELRYGENIWQNFTQFQHYPVVGDIIMFPSWLQHSVHQFYQEGVERISVAGNIKLLDEMTFENPYEHY
tara:strand:- start:1942 stop:2697 length:756 start_codon:yes stop_codon:yes gene_type:complete